MAGAWSNGRLLREAIGEAIGEGATIEDLEIALIEPAELNEDARDALWLFAWGSLERQRELARSS
jgi:hypothetical protein